jgi:hypothetical protein
MTNFTGKLFVSGRELGAVQGSIHYSDGSDGTPQRVQGTLTGNIPDQPVIAGMQANAEIRLDVDPERLSINILPHKVHFGSHQPTSFEFTSKGQPLAGSASGL